MRYTLRLLLANVQSDAEVFDAWRRDNILTH